MPRSNDSVMPYYDGHGEESDLIDVDYGDLSALRKEWNFGEYLVFAVAIMFFASVLSFLIYTCYRKMLHKIFVKSYVLPAINVFQTSRSIRTKITRDFDQNSAWRRRRAANNGYAEDDEIDRFALSELGMLARR